MKITISNGSELFADYSGLFTPTSYPFIFAFTNSIFKITGGTGSFRNASGSGTLRGLESMQTGNGLMYATGTISNFKKDKGEPWQAAQHAASSYDNLTFAPGFSSAPAIAGLDSSLFPNTHVLGNYFYQDQNGQLLAVNGLPESASLSLLGIGLVSLVMIRRRNLSNSGNRPLRTSL